MNQQQEQQINIFTLPSDHHKNILFYEICKTIDEESLLKYLKSNEIINSFYIVNEKRNLIIVSKDKTSKLLVYLNYQLSLFTSLI